LSERASEEQHPLGRSRHRLKIHVQRSKDVKTTVKGWNRTLPESSMYVFLDTCNILRQCLVRYSQNVLTFLK